MSEKPAVLVFTTAYFPFVGGAEVAIREATLRLKNEYDFFIFTSRMRRDLPRREIGDEGMVVRLGFGNKFDKFWFLTFGWFAAWLELRRLRGKVIFWVMDLSFGAAPAGFLKIFYPKIPLVFTIQYGYGDERVARGRFGFMNLALRLILAQADYLTAISSYLLNLCKQYNYIGEGTVICNGVDITNFQFSISNFQKKHNIIITVSRLVPKNGVDTIIKSIAELKKDIPDIKLHIVGDGPERKNLEHMAYGLGLAANTKFFGDVPYDEVPKYLAEADIFARPSRSEGMGNAFVEALAAGLPIVGTPVGGILDIIEDGQTGLFAKVNDPKDLADKIKILLENKTLSQKIVENGQRMVAERFSWDKVAELYDGVFGHELNAQKRILIATGIFPPDIGGPATYSKILLDELPKENFGVRVLSFGSVKKLPKGISHIVYFLGALQLGNNADVIFAQDPVSVGFPAMLAAKILRKKFILKIAGDYAWEQGVQRFGVKEVLDDFLKDKYRWEVEWLRKIEKFVANHAEKIIVPSEYLKNVVTKWGISPNRIFVIYNARGDNDLFRFPRQARGGVQSHAKPAQQLIISAGRLVPWKGFGALIEIMPDLLKSFPDLKLMIIGNGLEYQNLKSKILNLKLEDKIILTGNISHEKVLEYLSMADVFVLNTAYEGFSHLILEAMALGAPIITTNVGGNSELVEDGISGLLVKYNDKDALQETILKLLKEEKLAQKLTSVASKRVTEFSKERMINETIKILI